MSAIYVIGCDDTLDLEQILTPDALAELVKNNKIDYNDQYSFVIEELMERIDEIPEMKCLVQVSGKPLYALLTVKTFNNVGMVIGGCLNGVFVQYKEILHGYVPLTLDYNRF
jgi:hypothetical protein